MTNPTGRWIAVQYNVRGPTSDGNDQSLRKALYAHPGHPKYVARLPPQGLGRREPRNELHRAVPMQLQRPARYYIVASGDKPPSPPKKKIFFGPLWPRICQRRITIGAETKKGSNTPRWLRAQVLSLLGDRTAPPQTAVGRETCASACIGVSVTNPHAICAGLAWLWTKSATRDERATGAGRVLATLANSNRKCPVLSSVAMRV
jgi:hypothetical protein